MTGEFIEWVHAGTLLYVLNRNKDTDHTFTWVERYRDEAAFQAHLSSAELAKARARLPDLLAKPSEGMVLQQIAP